MFELTPGVGYKSKPIGGDDVRLPLDKMLGLLAGDVRHGREGVAEVGRGSLHAVSESIAKFGSGNHCFKIMSPKNWFKIGRFWL
jgi:hypothetical protein